MPSTPAVSPADDVVGATRVDGVEVLGSLSPSRAGDFLTCPLLFRFRTVDRLPEPVRPDAVRGTVVHKVLEALFDSPAHQRTPERAEGLLLPAWEELVAASPELAEVCGDDGPALTALLEGCRSALRTYFTLEDPTRLEPAEREVYVETLLGSQLLLRGFIDRLDVAPDGAIRVVDYKTGRAPSEAFEAAALFQLRFYALVLWRTRGVVPRVLQLVYLGNGEILRYEPDEQDLRATERKIEAVWAAIRHAQDTGEWLPRRGGLCRFCAHQAICPAWGGTPPPLPTPGAPAEVPGSEPGSEPVALGPDRGLGAVAHPDA